MIFARDEMLLGALEGDALTRRKLAVLGGQLLPLDHQIADAIERHLAHRLARVAGRGTTLSARKS